jgi:hypothetical protein
MSTQDKNDQGTANSKASTVLVEGLEINNKFRTKDIDYMTEGKVTIRCSDTRDHGVRNLKFAIESEKPGITIEIRRGHRIGGGEMVGMAAALRAAPDVYEYNIILGTQTMIGQTDMGRENQGVKLWSQDHEVLISSSRIGYGEILNSKGTLLEILCAATKALSDDYIYGLPEAHLGDKDYIPTMLFAHGLKDFVLDASKRSIGIGKREDA